MKRMIIIIDLHCDATMPLGAYEFGGGNKYSRSLINLLLKYQIPFIYITRKKFTELEEFCILGEHQYFYRIKLGALGISDKDFIQNYKQDAITEIERILPNFSDFYPIFHSIYWSSGEIALYFASKYHSYFVHTVSSNAKRKILQGAIDDNPNNRTQIEQNVFDNAKYIICSSISEAEDIQNLYSISREKTILTGRWVAPAYTNPYINYDGNPRTYTFNDIMPTHYVPHSMQKNNKTTDQHYIWTVQKTYLFVGRIHKNKGLIQIIKAWCKIYKEHNQSTPSLWIVGGTPDDIEKFRADYCYDKVIENAEKAQKILWWGTLNEEGISTLMQKALVFVMHSKYEASGNVILEAMAHALPIIATPYGYAKDYITHNENGFLVPYDDIYSLRKYMEYFMKQPYLSNYMGRLAREKFYDIISSWNFSQSHLTLYGIHTKVEEVEYNHKKVEVLKYSVDIFPHTFCPPDISFIRNLISKHIESYIVYIDRIVIDVPACVWRVNTSDRKYYFYYLYTMLNIKCIDYDQEELVLTKYQRTELFREKCQYAKIKIYYIDNSNGYVLLDELFEDKDV